MTIDEQRQEQSYTEQARAAAQANTASNAQLRYLALRETLESENGRIDPNDGIAAEVLTVWETAGLIDAARKAEIEALTEKS